MFTCVNACFVYCKYMNDLLFDDFFIIYKFVHFFFYYTKCLV